MKKLDIKVHFINLLFGYPIQKVQLSQTFDVNDDVIMSTATINIGTVLDVSVPGLGDQLKSYYSTELSGELSVNPITGVYTTQADDTERVTLSQAQLDDLKNNNWTVSITEKAKHVVDIAITKDMKCPYNQDATKDLIVHVLETPVVEVECPLGSCSCFVCNESRGANDSPYHLIIEQDGKFGTAMPSTGSGSGLFGWLIKKKMLKVAL